MFIQKETNKKGVLGGFIVSFIATIIILLFLLIYVIFSGVIKQTFDADDDVVIASKGAFIGYQEEVIVPYTFKLESILNCLGEYGGKSVLFLDLLDSWGEDSLPLVNFLEENNCSYYSFKIFNLENSKAIKCYQNSCFVYDFKGNNIVSEREIEFYISNKIKMVFRK